MQATHGLALFRLRTRVIGCITGIALALAALALAFASTARAAEPPQKTYLASGTSITFGYSQGKFNELFPGEQPKKFNEAYPKNSHQPDGLVVFALEKLKAKNTATSAWTTAVNDGCPGETSDSYLGTGPLGKTLEVAIPGAHGEAACAYHYGGGQFALHHEYEPGQSQLENVLQVIAQNAATTHPVSLVSLEIGANDLLAAVHLCEKEVKEGLWPGPEGLTECEVAKLAGTIRHLATNISAALFAIRNGALFGGVNYTGKFTFGGFYNPFGAVFTPGVEINPGSNLLEFIVNIFIKKAVTPFGACYTNPQTNPGGAPTFARAWNPAVGGINPGAEPGILQAWSNMANFTFAKRPLTEGTGDLTSGSNIVTNLKELTNFPLALAFIGPSTLATGGLVEGAGIPAGTTVARVLGATAIELTKAATATGSQKLEVKGANGPDIHPTPVGYEELANIAEEECPA